MMQNIARNVKRSNILNKGKFKGPCVKSGAKQISSKSNTGFKIIESSLSKTHLPLMQASTANKTEFLHRADQVALDSIKVCNPRHWAKYGLTNINKLGLKTNLIADDITHVDEIKMAKDHGMQGVNVTLQGSSTVESLMKVMHCGKQNEMHISFEVNGDLLRSSKELRGIYAAANATECVDRFVLDINHPDVINLVNGLPSTCALEFHSSNSTIMSYYNMTSLAGGMDYINSTIANSFNPLDILSQGRYNAQALEQLNSFVSDHANQFSASQGTINRGTSFHGTPTIQTVHVVTSPLPRDTTQSQGIHTSPQSKTPLHPRSIDPSRFHRTSRVDLNKILDDPTTEETIAQIKNEFKYFGG